jgi:Uma2 family endonuclease
MVATKHHTAIELENMGSESERYELVRGELREVAAAGARHGQIEVKLSSRLSNLVEEGKLGVIFGSDTGFVVTNDPDTLLMPDVSFVRTARLPAGELWEGFVPFAPDLAVEIESPSNREGEMLEKVALYLAGGTQLVWLIRPRHRSVTIFRPAAPEQVLTENDTLDAGELVPGFSLLLADLFRGIPNPK